MGTNERRLDRLDKRARDAITEVAERDARRIVAIWNGRRAKGRELWFHLRIGGAIAADHPGIWLYCLFTLFDCGKVFRRISSTNPAAAGAVLSKFWRLFVVAEKCSRDSTAGSVS